MRDLVAPVFGVFLKLSYITDSSFHTHYEL
jgi:hypothetical protein